MHRAILGVQGVFYVATGLWAIFSIRTFQEITGPKVDLWLVKTVGVLVTVIGSVLALAALRRRRSPEIDTLAAGSALALATIDIVYSTSGRISKVYLLDAIAETALAASLAATRAIESPALDPPAAWSRRRQPLIARPA
jgi:hypothetical protein